MKLPVIHTIGQRPEPLLTRATVTSAVTGLSSALISFGVLPAALGDQITTAAKVVIGCVFTTIAVIAPIVQALSSRKVVTPVDDPHDGSGRPLEPAAAADAEAARVITSVAPTVSPVDTNDEAVMADFQVDDDPAAALGDDDEQGDPEASELDDGAPRPQPHHPRHLEV